jgi:hypothetical protein
LIRSFTLPLRSQNKADKVDSVAMMAHLRSLTLALKDRNTSELTSDDSPEQRSMEPIWAPEDEIGHRVEVARELSEGDPRPLAAQGASGARVYLIDGARLRITSSLAKELGRLREQVFRSVGEGTGKSLDFDNHFDLEFSHLVALACICTVSGVSYGEPKLGWYCTAEGLNSYKGSEYIYGEWRISRSKARESAIENCSDRPLSRCRVRYCDKTWYNVNDNY